MSSLSSKPLLLILVVLLAVGCRSSPQKPPAYQFAETWGGSGTAPAQFRNPIGLAISGGEVFVSEAGNHRIQVFDRTGQALRRIGPALGTGDTLRRPMHIDAHGSALYVPDFNTDRVHVLSPTGTLRRSLGPSGFEAGFDAPGGVAVDSAGRLYVADFYHHRVLRFGRDGSLDCQWGTTDSTGKAPDRFTYPTDVAVLPGGGFVVADAYNHRIKRYEADGSLAWMRPRTQNWADSTKGTFNVATAVAAGPDGHVFVADFYNHRIQEFTPDGQFVRMFGEQGSGEGQFERPVDVAVAADGTLYVVDFGNDRVQVFAPTRPLGSPELLTIALPPPYSLVPMDGMTRSEVAEKAGVNPETLRYYERKEIIPKPRRSDGGFRLYDDHYVERLRFIQRAKELGFTLAEIKDLLDLRVNEEATCSDVRKQATAKIEEVEEKLQDLRRIRDALTRLADACAGGEGPTSDCPILDVLKGEAVPTPSS